jgi:hypothetical protein
MHVIKSINRVMVALVLVFTAYGYADHLDDAIDTLNIRVVGIEKGANVGKVEGLKVSGVDMSINYGGPLPTIDLLADEFDEQLHTTLLELLESHSADVITVNGRPLVVWLASKLGTSKLFVHIIMRCKPFDINISDANGSTVLIELAKTNRSILLKRILACNGHSLRWCREYFRSGFRPRTAVV